jgi:hypothetical protein
MTTATRTIEGYETRQVRKATGRETALWLVIKPETIAGVGPTIIGMVEKYRNTRTDTHPYKAFMGTGHDAHYIESFYGPNGFTDAVRTIAALSIA